MFQILKCFFVALLITGSVHGQEKTDVRSFPLEVFPQGSNDILVFFVTGDGGWSAYNKQLSATFSRHGYSVVALNSKKYFWNEKDPATFSRDAATILKYYMTQWKKSRCIIVGYSFGADVIPFLPPDLPDLRKKILMMALLSPAVSTDFDIHLSDLLSTKEVTDYKYKPKPQIEAGLIPAICIFGKDEDLALKKELKETAMLHVVVLPGDHRYNNDASAPVNEILSFLNTLKK